MGTLERAIFALSLTELGQSHTYVNTEGSALPIASTLRIAHLQRERHHPMDPLPVHEQHQLRRLGLGSDGNIDRQLLHQLQRVPPRFHSPLLPLCER